MHGMNKEGLYREALVRMIEVLRQHRSLLVYIQGSPDPDALASAFAITSLCEMLGVRAEIVASAEPSLAQNKEIIKKCKIPLRVEKHPEKLTGFNGYAIVDFQSVHVAGLTDRIPCVLHIDHHEPVKETVPVQYKLIDEKAGSTSTMIALAFKESFAVEFNELLRKTGSALVLGIQTDTDKMVHANEVDFIALSFLSQFSDSRLIDEIIGIPLSGATLSILEKAVAQKAVYKDWLIAGAGYVEESNRDSIAIAADYLLGSGSISAVVVFAIVVKKNGEGFTLDASVRSRNSDFDMDAFIKEITANGGGRRFKGAFQVSLDFFTYCPDRTMLWEMVSKTVHHAVVIKRDELPIIELKGLYRRVKNKVSSLFRNFLIVGMIVLLAASHIACAKKFGMERKTGFADRINIEIDKRGECALLRQRDFDVAVSELSETGWAKLYAMSQYQKKRGFGEARIPRLHFFHIILFNVGKSPLSIPNVFIRYDGQEIQEMQNNEILRRLSSPAYAAIDFKKVLENKRYLGDKWCISEIDYERDVIGYDFNAIPAGDAMIWVAVFDWIPVQHRKFSIVIRVRNEINGEEKTVDFPFERKEFRTKGKYFIKEERKE